MRLTLLLLLLLIPGCGRPEPSPPWAPGLSVEEAAHLESLVQSHLGPETRVESGKVTRNGQPYPLVSLAREVAGKPRESWPAQVREHFQVLERSEAARALPPLQAVRGQVLLRLVPESFAAQHPNSVTRRDLPGTATAVVIEQADAVRFLVYEDVDRWGVPPAELFRLGAENLARMSFPKPSELELENLGVLKIVTGESPFISSLALQLERHPELLGKEGALVAVPLRNMLLAYPVEDLTAVGAMHRMALMTSRLQDEEAVSSGLYYFNGGKLVSIPYQLKGDDFRVNPPPELSVALQRLRNQPVRPGGKASKSPGN
ncbi:MAG: hypothetical protein HY319_23995 [Armatimonadetes bacterium]|nr:hypothetical protein [Armatimonadota bacterium]